MKQRSPGEIIISHDYIQIVKKTDQYDGGQYIGLLAHYIGEDDEDIAAFNSLLELPEILQDEVRRLKKHRDELQENNNKLLMRARLAETELTIIHDIIKELIEYRDGYAPTVHGLDEILDKIRDKVKR